MAAKTLKKEIKMTLEQLNRLGVLSDKVQKLGSTNGLSQNEKKEYAELASMWYSENAEGGQHLGQFI